MLYSESSAASRRLAQWLPEPPGYGDWPLIAFLVVAGPALAMLAFDLIDRQGQAAREIWLWLRFMRGSGPSAEGAAVIASLDAPSGTLDQTARALRAIARPLLLDPDALRLRVLVYIQRFISPVVYAAFAVVAVAAFTAVLILTPECPTTPDRLPICH